MSWRRVNLSIAVSLEISQACYHHFATKYQAPVKLVG
jgi:hypothetical protein